MPVFPYDSYLMDRPASGCRFLVFPLLMLLNCPPNMCHTLNPIYQLHKKWIIRNIVKTSLLYCSLNSASPYSLKYLNNGGYIQNVNTDSKCEIFYRRTKYLEANQWLHNQNYEAYQASPHPPPPQKKNVTLSYPHKIDWGRLTNVWYGSFTGSGMLEINIIQFTDSLETGHGQTVI